MYNNFNNHLYVKGFSIFRVQGIQTLLKGYSLLVTNMKRNLITRLSARNDFKTILSNIKLDRNNKNLTIRLKFSCQNTAFSF